VQRRTELATACADIEQTADLGHQPAHLRRDSRHVIGRIDRRGIELERIEDGFWDRKRRDGHSRTRGTSTVTAKPWLLTHLTMRGEAIHQDTPPDAFAYDRG
jgi:hypothetical protein